MEKGTGDLWDDSAIVDAFNHAVSKYKVMHKREQHKPAEGEKVTNDNPEIMISTAVGDQDVTRSINAVDDNNAVTETNVGEVTAPPPFQDNHQVESSAPKTSMHDASSSHMHEATEGYKKLEGEEEYNRLLGHYYELEEQRQKVLQQLQEVSYGNYQFTGEGSSSYVGWGNSTQAHQDPNAQVGDPNAQMVSSCCPYSSVSSCCPCVCDGFVGSSPLMPSCALPSSRWGTTACTGGPGRPSSYKDESVMKTAMGAAERAISSMKLKTLSTSTAHEEKQQENTDSLKGEMAENISSGTSLDVVLSAWYSAGFHTGRYLLEQSKANEKHE